MKLRTKEGWLTAKSLKIGGRQEYTRHGGQTVNLTWGYGEYWVRRIDNRNQETLAKHGFTNLDKARECFTRYRECARAVFNQECEKRDKERSAS